MKHKNTVIASILIVLIFYLFISTCGRFTYNLNNKFISNDISYGHLTLSLANKRLSLFKEPNPELKRLSNPYEPKLNKNYKWHDASYYKEKYFLYFGISPVIALYLPYYLLTKCFLLDSLACLIFMFGGFLFSALLLNFFARRFTSVRKKEVLVSTLTLGFANLGGYMAASGSQIYHVAIASGYFFLSGGLFFLLTAFSGRKFSSKKLFWGSLFCGLAVGSRPNLIFASLILLIFLSFNISKNKHEKNKLLFLLIPFSLTILLLLSYNYFRFDNPFELGLTYQVGNFDFTKYKFIKLDNIFQNFSIYFFTPPIIDSNFTFIHQRPTMTIYNKMQEGFYSFDKFTGILYLTPVIIFIPYLLTILKKRFGPLRSCFKDGDMLVILFIGLINLLIDLTYSSAYVRYMPDFLSYFILASFICWFILIESSIGIKEKNILIRTGQLLSVLSIIQGIALSIEGYNNYLSNCNPEIYNQLKSFFN